MKVDSSFPHLNENLDLVDFANLNELLGLIELRWFEMISGSSSAAKSSESCLSLLTNSVLLCCFSSPMLK